MLSLEIQGVYTPTPPWSRIEHRKRLHIFGQGDFKRILHKNYHILEASNPHYQLKTSCLYPPARLSSSPCLVTLIHESQPLSFGLWSCWPKEPARHVCPHGDGSGCIHTVYTYVCALPVRRTWKHRLYV